MRLPRARKMIRKSLGSIAMAASLATPALAQSADGVAAGQFRIEPPTLLSAGFEWRIGGDDNRNASVTVFYRKRGDAEWRKGPPMLRLNGEQVLGGTPRHGDPHFYSYTAPNMFAGSLLNLEPGTDYEARFVLADPDGVSGTAETTVFVHTRSEPKPATDGQVYHVYPYSYKGTKQEPAFTGLMAAYFRGSDQSDHSMTMPPRVQPGDIILVHAGVYKDEWLSYGGFDPAFGGYGTPFDGTYYLTQSGTAERPIVIKAAGDGEVVFDGGNNHNLFNLLAANYNYFEGITVRNTDVAFLLGLKNITGSSGFSLVRSKIFHVGRGVQDEWEGSKNVYVADNVFIGRHRPDKLVGWWPTDVWEKVPGFPARLDSEYAVKVYGQGHVVAHNYVAGWHDGIDVSTYGTPSLDVDKIPSSIDFYRNDISNIDDNCIEADGSAQNIRVFENRCFNAAAGALSVQPIFGGPAYFYRNIVYNSSSGGPLKFVDNAAGVLFYNNTLIGQGRLWRPVSNTHFRNNLFIGDGWNELLFDFQTFTNYSSSDYNGFRPNPGVKSSFGWTSPAFKTSADYSHPLVERHFGTLKDYAKATGQDKHSLLLDYDAFEKLAPPDRSDIQRLYKPAEVDLRLRAGSAAIDKGVELPGITDGFAGKAPDLGAYERDAAIPHYGPRTWPVGSSADNPGGAQ